MKRLIYKLFVVLLLAFSLIGCIESPVEQQNQIINGKIYGHRSYDFLLVSGGLQPVSFMSWFEDEFDISVSKKPYELYVYGFYYYQYNYPRFTLKYSNLNINDLNILTEDLPREYFYLKNDHCSVDIYFPVLWESKLIAIKFLSDDEFTQSSDDIHLVFSGRDYFYYVIRIPENKETISGKLYYLEITVDQRNRWNFLSFDKFGMKDVTFHKWGNDPVIFAEEDLSYNPPEYNMPVNINIPPEYGIRDVFISLSVPSKFKASDLPLYRFEGNVTNVNKLTPILPGNEFKIKVYAKYSASQIFESEGNEFAYFAPGEPANLTHTRTLNMITPANQQKDVVESTQFEITDIDEPAVYEYTLCVDPEKYLSYYTTEKSIKFSDFRTAFFSPFKNKLYYWQVRKFPKFCSTDEFLSKPYVLDNRLNYIELSEMRSFTTAP